MTALYDATSARTYPPDARRFDTIGRFNPPFLPALFRGEAGAMLVVGVPMAIMLTALIYHMIGIGNAVILSEDLRRAADDAAYDGAVRHARAMNLLAVMNIMMMAIEAVSVVWSLLKGILTLVVLNCSQLGIAACPAGATTAATTLAQQLDPGQPMLDDWVYAQLHRLSTLEQQMSTFAPAIAAEGAVDDFNRSPPPTVAYALAWAGTLISDDTLQQSGLSLDPRLSARHDGPAMPVEAQPASFLCPEGKLLATDVTHQLLDAAGADAVWQTLPIIHESVADDIAAIGPDLYCISLRDPTGSPDPPLAADFWHNTTADFDFGRVAFQVYGFAFSGGTVEPFWADRGVQLADPTAQPTGARVPSWIGSAAEYYFHCDDHTWSDCAFGSMYAPRWAARLIRIHSESAIAQNTTHSLLDLVAAPLNDAYVHPIPPGIQSVFSDTSTFWDRVDRFLH
jgi:hypothetical protein